MVVVNKLQADVGDKIKLEKVLVVGSSQFTVIGTPLLKCGGANALMLVTARSNKAVEVQATVIEQLKSKKIQVFKKKRRKGYNRRRGLPFVHVRGR